ncbi:MAG: SDR family oxidoreductase [Caldilineaceae bacterium]|nr:SDR family oxidoreductase [Caldilineaceae bacterium]
MSEFEGKSVIVTGGASGIGRAICLAFAREGASVLCADVNTKAGQGVEEEAKNLSGSVVFRAADVSQAGDCQQLVAWVDTEWGGIDVLCNNVGIQPLDYYVPIHELSEAKWDRLLDVNLKSAFLMIKEVVPTMLAQGGGVIINTASVQGLQSAKNVSAYAASKGGLLSLTRQVALEYAENNIRVLAVNPGTIETPLVLIASNDDLEAARAEAARTHPLGRIGKPEDIANAVLFLASDRASFMTGEYVCVDGGLMAKGAWS